MRGPPQRFKRECPVLWRAQVLAASDGSGRSTQDTEHCRRWKRDLNVWGQGWEGGDVAGTLSQASSTHPHNQTHTHEHVHTPRRCSASGLLNMDFPGGRQHLLNDLCC